MRLKLILCLFLYSACVFAQTKADDVLGKYMGPDGDAIIQIYESKGKYYGKLSWINHPENLDTKNPDVTKQSQKVLGMVIMNDFVFDGKDTWKNGTIYDPKNGKTYDCKITRNEKENLYLRGYIGISLLGRTEYFVKLKN